MKPKPSAASRFALPCFVTVASLLAVPALHAASATWDGSDDSLWATGTNWSATPVPGTGDTATFNNAGNGNVILDLGGGVTVKTVLFDTASAAAYTIGSSSAQSLTLDSTGSITMNPSVTSNQTFSAPVTLGTTVDGETFSITNNSTTNSLNFGEIKRTASESFTFTVSGDGTINADRIQRPAPGGAWTLTKAGTGTLNLNGTLDNRFLNLTMSAGTVVLNKSVETAKALSSAFVTGGTLQLAGSTGDQVNSGITVTSGGVLDLNGRSETGNTISLNGTGIGAGGALVNNSGTTSILSSIAVNFQSGASIGGSGNITLDVGTTGAFNITKVGNATLTLGGAVNNATGLIVSGGTVVLNKTSSAIVHAATAATVNGGTLQLSGSGGDQIGGNITVNSGVLDLNGKDEDGGTTTLNGTGIGGNGALVNNSGTASIFNPTSVTFGSATSIGGSGNITISSGTTGGQDVTKVGTGTLTLAGTVDNASLKLIVSNGTVVLDKTAPSVRAASSATVNGGTLQLAGDNGDQIFGALTVNTGGIVDLNGRNEALSLIAGDGGTIYNTANATTSTITLTGGTADFAGVIADNAGGGQTGKVALIKFGAFTQTLSGNNTYTGDTTVTNGILTVTAPNFDDSSTVTLGSSAMLTLPNEGTDIVGSLVIGGNPQLPGLYTFGTGKLQVGGSNPYTTWSGGAAFDDDANNDGVSNGLAWILGAGSPTDNAALGLLPEPVQSGGNLTLTFTQVNPITPNQLFVEYSRDLGITDPWHRVEVPADDDTVDGIIFDITPATPNSGVTLTIPASKAAGGGKLFSRLVGVQN